MQKTENTILITGGSTGIGLAMAEAFVQSGNEVLICGMPESKLSEAKNSFPQLHTRVCDLAKNEEREALFDWVVSNFPEINMLVNNAGIQKEVDFLTGATGFYNNESEIEINLVASIHLCALFTPHFFSTEA